MSTSRGTESPTGWYIAVIILRFESKQEDRSRPRRMCTTHENLTLIKARNSEEAYREALLIGEAFSNVECVDQQGRKGSWVFEGLNELLPVYDEIENGCELMWTLHYCSVSTAKGMVKEKGKLQAFRAQTTAPAP